jgi:hypothetical protein
MQIATIGLDIAKNAVQVQGIDAGEGGGGEPIAAREVDRIFRRTVALRD